MIKEEMLDTLINQYYDGEMNDLELISFEARMAVSAGIREYTNRQCYNYFKISNSIKLTKNRCHDKASQIVNKFEQKQEKSIINFNSVRFKCFYEHLRNRFLNALRNDTQ
ncbi:MAG: hypothetical protein IJ877_03630 [Candidatus Gastranaerophilales bacterium]|nr:hypothetical protein [Candidatus Gastranaerophilales bacterium]